MHCRLQADQGQARAKIYTCAKIISEHIDEDGASELVVEIDAKYLGMLKSVKCERIG
jgi:GTP-binding protein HflX